MDLSCHVHGRPYGSNDRGTGADLDDYRRKFKKAQSRLKNGRRPPIIVGKGPRQVGATSTRRPNEPGRAQVSASAYAAAITACGAGATVSRIYCRNAA